MLEKWESQGSKKQGTWQEVFGADIYTDELFMAWHYARYVEKEWHKAPGPSTIFHYA